MQAGDLSGAAAIYRSVKTDAPEYAVAQFNLGVALYQQGKLDMAISALEAATKAAPKEARFWSTLGRIRMRRDDFAGAAKAYRTALDLAPDNATDWAHLAGALRFQRSYNDAIDAARKALDLDPQSEHALISLLHAQMRACAWDGIQDVRARLKAAVQSQIAAGGRIHTRPFQAVVSYDDPAFQKQVADHEARQILDKPRKRIAAPATTKGDKIKIGYLSAGFRNHPTGHLAKGLFSLHDRDRFSTVALSLGQNDGSDLRQAIVRSVDRFIDIDRHSDAEVGAIIQAEGIDVLVDLHGFLQGHRIGIAAQKAAPVSVNYLGFPGTTGAGLHDYILLDPIIAPDPDSAAFSEAVIRLPGSYQINDAQDFVDRSVVQSDEARRRPEGRLSRHEAGLPGGAVFCCFNMPYKIDEQAFDAWCAILKTCPDAVLWLLDEDPVAENLRHQARDRGVDPDRLIFGPPLTRDKHLERLSLADVALDTWICGGHTTTTDCLFAGVPVVTKPGASFASRVAASLVSNAGLTECVAEDREAYIRTAVDLANDPERRASIRQTLRTNGPDLPLFDLPAKVRALERAYTQMIQRHRNGEPPAAFDVE